ncbi:hypothetical protein [Rhodococcus sp. B50]|uniref:hypothetical protein n=1 Tax=Rhodococcus sp. B50 TaxID=2682847 RepID=UPI001BD55CCC|nr:hypothetical protein [Rhodococcus sp. B50]MBS9376162.1 hypothetical protein [Rhodococcus sp. B50]
MRPALVLDIDLDELFARAIREQCGVSAAGTEQEAPSFGSSQPNEVTVLDDRGFTVVDVKRVQFAVRGRRKCSPDRTSV